MTTIREPLNPGTGSDAEIARLRAELAEWRARFEKGELREIAFTNSSGPVDPLFTAADEHASDVTALGVPGTYPYTRGIHPTGYRGKLWTMRQFAGFGSAADTNARYKFLLEQGQTGLSVAFDFPTLMGYDSDHPRSEGEVGKCGVAISSLADMETLFDGIPLDQVSTSMTINGPAIILFCFYVAAAEKQGIDSRKLRGTIQNDILKEYMAQHAWVYPIEPALRLIVDVLRVERDARAAVEHDLDLRLPYPRGRRHGGAGARVHARRRLHVRRARHRARPARSTTSRRGFRSSGTSTTISSRRSPSSARRAASGRGT